MLLQREGPDLALNSRAGSHQICPLLKVDRPCRRAAVTSQFDPFPTLAAKFAVMHNAVFPTTAW